MKFQYTGGNDTNLINFQEPAEDFLNFCVVNKLFTDVSFDYDETLTTSQQLKNIFDIIDFQCDPQTIARREAERERDTKYLISNIHHSCSLPQIENSERYLFKDFPIPSKILDSSSLYYLKKFKESGSNVFITTLRSREFNEFYGKEYSIEHNLVENFLDINVFYTTGLPKSETIAKNSIGSTIMHFDDSKSVLLELSNCGIFCICVSKLGKLFYNPVLAKNWFPSIMEKYKMEKRNGEYR